MVGMHVLSFVIVATRAFVRIVLKHRVRDARVRKRRREEYARRGLHHSLPEHRLFRAIERQTSSTRVAKTQISRNVCPFPVSRDDDFFTFCVASFREEKKIREESIARDIARSRKIDGKMHPTGRYEARCTSQNLRCPFYERSRVSVPLSASLSRVPSQALNHCFFALYIFFLFSPFFVSLLSFACIRTTQFRARRSCKKRRRTSKKNRDPRFARRGSVLFERSCLWRCDECAAFTSHFELEKMQDLPLSFCFRRSSHFCISRPNAFRPQSHSRDPSFAE